MANSFSFHPYRLRCLRLALALGLMVIGFAGAPSAARAETKLSVLSYNVHGLPSPITGDRPRKRMRAIGNLADKYDVVLLQEDFAYNRIIRRRIEDSVRVRGNSMQFDPRRWVAKIMLAPVALIASYKSGPYGSGLTTFVKTPFARPGDALSEPYGICDGWLGAELDCWASKGYLRVGVQTSEGVSVDVYTTHLDAGRGRRSIRTRRHQLRMLADAIEQQSSDRAIIVGGDLNLAAERPGDWGVMMEFRHRLGLRDSGAGPESSRWRDRDYILYRSGSQAQIRVETAGEAHEFVDGARALSDHPAVYARFIVSPQP